MSVSYLLERLSYSSCGLCLEASLEIERLRAALDNALTVQDRMMAEIEKLKQKQSKAARMRNAIDAIDLASLRAENAKLRAALQEIATHRIDSSLASKGKRDIARKALKE